MTWLWYLLVAAGAGAWAVMNAVAASERSRSGREAGAKAVERGAWGLPALLLLPLAGGGPWWAAVAFGFVVWAVLLGVQARLASWLQGDWAAGLPYREPEQRGAGGDPRRAQTRLGAR